jgi:hypothetical protein
LLISRIIVILFNRRQEEITAEREEIDRQKKMLLKKRPSNSETARKRSSTQQQQQQQQQQQGQASAILHNGTDATFLKPDAIPGFSWQEYYEADEILKVSSTFPSFLFSIERNMEGIRSLNIYCLMASGLHSKGKLECLERRGMVFVEHSHQMSRIGI